MSRADLWKEIMITGASGSLEIPVRLARILFWGGGGRICSIGTSIDLQQVCGIWVAERWLVRFQGSFFPGDREV